MLQKHTPPQKEIPVCAIPLANTRAAWRPIHGTKFPAGLCYLATVRGANRQAAVEALSHFPTVAELMKSPLIERTGTLLVEQAPSLYHMVTKYTSQATTLFLACSNWKVGVHLPDRPHPGHHAGHPQCPLGHCPRPSFPPQETVAPAVPLSVPAPRPKFRNKPKLNRGPFHPYAKTQQPRRPGSPAAQWKAALADPLDDTMECFKKELDVFPTTLAVPAWQDLLAHLAILKKHPDFNRKECVPAVADRFSTILEKVKSDFTAIQEDEKAKEETLTRESAILVDLVERYWNAEAALEQPPLGADPSFSAMSPKT